jgi:hypothetical protein
LLPSEGVTIISTVHAIEFGQRQMMTAVDLIAIDQAMPRRKAS